MTDCCGTAAMTVWIKMYYYWFFVVSYCILNLLLFNANSLFYPGARICYCSLLMYEYLSVTVFSSLGTGFCFLFFILLLLFEWETNHITASSFVATVTLPLRSFPLVMKIRGVWRNRFLLLLLFLETFFIFFLVWLLDLPWIDPHLKWKKAKQTNKRILQYQITLILNQFVSSCFLIVAWAFIRVYLQILNILFYFRFFFLLWIVLFCDLKKLSEEENRRIL